MEANNIAGLNNMANALSVEQFVKNKRLTNEQRSISDAMARQFGGLGPDYDYGQVTMGPNGDGHFTDAGKLPNHPTFSNESKYSSVEKPGGSWREDKGKWIYTPSAWQLKQPGYEDKLNRYFQQEYGKGIDGIDFRNRPKDNSQIDARNT